MLTMRNKTKLIAILAVIVIGVIGISAYLLQGTGRQQKELTPVSPTPASPQVPEIDTSDWKVYRNEEHGFEFKYPKDFTLQEGYNLPDKPRGTLFYGLELSKQIDETTRIKFSFSIGEKPRDLSLHDLIVKESYDPRLNPEFADPKYKDLTKIGYTFSINPYGLEIWDGGFEKYEMFPIFEGRIVLGSKKKPEILVASTFRLEGSNNQREAERWYALYKTIFSTFKFFK
jgi:hypothetical protein